MRPRPSPGARLTSHQGIDFLVEKGLLENTPDAIAQMLLRDADSLLDKTAIGEYLGEGCVARARAAD